MYIRFVKQGVEFDAGFIKMNMSENLSQLFVLCNINPAIIMIQEINYSAIINYLLKQILLNNKSSWQFVFRVFETVCKPEDSSKLQAF